MTAGPSMIDDANPASADKSIMTTEPVVPAGPVDLGVVELAVLMSASCYSRSGSWGDYDNLLGDCGRADPTLVRYLQPRPATVSQAFEVSLLVFCGDLGESTTEGRVPIHGLRKSSSSRTVPQVVRAVRLPVPACRRIPGPTVVQIGLRVLLTTSRRIGHLCSRAVQHNLCKILKPDREGTRGLVAGSGNGRSTAGSAVVVRCGEQPGNSGKAAVTLAGTGSARLCPSTLWNTSPSRSSRRMVP